MTMPTRSVNAGPTRELSRPASGELIMRRSSPGTTNRPAVVALAPGA